MKALFTKCQVPTKGWECTRRKGHAGPCAAVPEPNWLGKFMRWLFVPSRLR